LEARDYVINNSGGEGFLLGPKFVQVGEAIRNIFDLRLVAKPVMEKVANETGETVNISIRRGNRILLIDTKRGSNRIQVEDPIGSIYPLHAGAGSKVLLACLPRAEQDNLIDSISLVRFTDNTIVNREKLRQTLEQVCRQGYGLDDEEHEAGIWGVGAPIYDAAGRTVASISVFVSSAQYDTDGKLMLIRTVKSAGEEISELLGKKA
jgi:DNA-binding IclR family transcriptional regulator